MSLPDLFHHVRVSQSQLKAAHINVQLAEYNSHKNLVDEYKQEMLDHQLDLDTKTRPNLALIQQQPEINLRMRPLLLDFLMDVINKLNLSKLTFPLTANIIDRYCLLRIVKKQHYQLLGLTALWIACKNLDSKFRIPLLSDLCKYCCHCYDKKLFLEMENHVLKLLNWLVNAPTFDCFIDSYIHTLAALPFLAGSRNPHKVCNDVKFLAIYICELVQFYPNLYFNYLNPKLALIAVMIALLILEVSPAFLVASFLTHLSSSVGSEILTATEFETAFGQHLKVLKCPPPLLKTKYFNTNLRFLPLMKKMIAFACKNLAPVNLPLAATPMVSPRDLVLVTPISLTGSTTPKYPATPALNSMSPRVLDYRYEKRPTLTNRILLDIRTLPLPVLLPAQPDGFMKRKQEFDQPAHKRLKSMTKAVFYIQ